MGGGNTVSNLIMIIPPIFGAIQSIRDGLEKRYIAAFLALTVVGMGSWCFHMTLKYEMQFIYKNTLPEMQAKSEGSDLKELVLKLSPS
ncbi:hypothetical protein A6R68_05065 [Neotoma lepida]|uniref:Alkaline ceramidase n=1 Tax=Neotoma lepida TaxID=56216 RepID=A0A1A6GJL0_NEOLE|nr:hypothetical protein A6R68_05065 [Neotoma lepida]